MNFLQCYISFFKISMFTFGGGYAMLPMTEKELIEGKKCLTEKEMLEAYALAQTVPGIIGANTSAIIGKKIHGIKGAIASTLGFITPSLIIIMLISDLLIKYQDNIIINNALKGIKFAVLALLINIFIKLLKQSKEYIQNTFGITLVSLAFIAVLFLKISTIYIIIISAFAGIVYYLRKEK
ncbi:chromate transporter [Abyssisolibacter fermentans]|uniref:chromate transporter n=1 Tax=Abyssisolibacter fermentans TaxID=1766203 RepID=UPI000836886D|nr:chromate transporter [Abyssisolibacter fermentans]